MIDGEYEFFTQQLIILYTKIGIKNCKIRVNMQFIEEPCPQERILGQARWEYYAYASKVYPARKGLQCEYEDCECDGSDVVGCTYCRAPIPSYNDYDDYY